jgi:hypothetical protein
MDRGLGQDHPKRLGTAVDGILGYETLAFLSGGMRWDRLHRGSKYRVSKDGTIHIFFLNIHPFLAMWAR